MRKICVLPSLCLMTAAVLLSGCSMTTTAVDGPTQGAALQGVLHGGQSGINKAHVYLMAASTAGYGGASVSLLNAAVTGLSDSLGGYVLSDAGGNFTLPTGSYTCAAGQQVYVYSLGGDPGAGVNLASGLMAVLGNCPGGTFAAQVPFVTVNEVSTVAAAYAMAGFATDSTHVASAATALSQTGLKNAFANAAQLVSVGNAVALATTPNGNGVVPQATINTLANVLAGCVNSAGGGSPGCTLLFGYVKSGGATGTTATEVATEAIYIAHNPGVQVANVYGLATSSAPFVGLTGSTPPSDFTIGISYTGNGINAPSGVAIDAAGNAWIANGGGNTITELSSTGVPVGSSPFSSGGATPQAIAFDNAGFLWVANIAGNTVAKLSSTGASSFVTSAGGLVNAPGGIALDTLGTAWVASVVPANGTTPQLLSINSSGTLFVGINGGGMNQTQGVAIDFAGSKWVTSSTGVLTKVVGNSPALAATPSAVATGVAIGLSNSVWVADAASAELARFTPPGSLPEYTGGGLDGSIGLAMDGAGTAWVANNVGLNLGVDGITAISNGGSALSPSTGYFGGGTFFPYGVAVDGSGDVWATNPNTPSVKTGTVTELIGAGVPVVTPIVAGLFAPYTPASKP